MSEAYRLGLQPGACYLPIEGTDPHVEQYKLIFNAIQTPLALFSVDADGNLRFQKLNDAFFALHHLVSDEWLDRPINEVLDPLDANAIAARSRKAIDAQESLTFEEAYQSGRGGAIFELTFTPVFSAAGTCIYVLFAGRDITSRKQSDAVMHHLAYYDALTGFPNRNYFQGGLETLLQALDERRMAVLALGIDNFKRINDSLGHDVGDHLLQELARRMSKHLRANDRVGRLGGDEFVMLLTDCGDLESVQAIADRIHQVLSVPFSIAGHELFPRASIGISRFPEDGSEACELIKHADSALYQAKQEQLPLKVYSAGSNSNASERLVLEGQLRKALERSEFILHYQPQVRMETGRIMGAEALIRWKHPELGTVSPAKFIPLAEETGLIVPITEWVLDTACRQQVEWVKAGFGPLRIAINLSGRHFQQYDLVGLVRQVIARTGIDPRYLELELTEGILIDKVESTIETMRQLTEIGVTFSIDDFGTGYSSLGYLKRFPTHTLKIDQSFVRKLSPDTEDAAITGAIIAMARALKLETIAEGVETTEQLALLRAQGCDGIQGYLFSRPLPADAFVGVLNSQQTLFTSPSGL